MIPNTKHTPLKTIMTTLPTADAMDITLAAVLGPSLVTVIIAIGTTVWDNRRSLGSWRQFSATRCADDMASSRHAPTSSARESTAIALIGLAPACASSRNACTDPNALDIDRGVLKISVRPSAVVTYPDRARALSIVPVFARRLPSAGVPRMREPMVPSTPAIGSASWK